MYYKNNYSMSHKKMLQKKTVIDICTSYDVSGYSLKEYLKTSTKACKTLVNQI